MWQMRTKEALLWHPALLLYPTGAGMSGSLQIHFTQSKLCLFSRCTVFHTWHQLSNCWISTDHFKRSHPKLSHLKGLVCHGSVGWLGPANSPYLEPAVRWLSVAVRWLQWKSQGFPGLGVQMAYFHGCMLAGTWVPVWGLAMWPGVLTAWGVIPRNTGESVKGSSDLASAALEYYLWHILLVKQVTKVSPNSKEGKSAYMLMERAATHLGRETDGNLLGDNLTAPLFQLMCHFRATGLSFFPKKIKLDIEILNENESTIKKLCRKIIFFREKMMLSVPEKEVIFQMV